MVSQSSWEPTLEQLSWRVDVKTAARGVADHSQPTAIVEMSLGHGKSASSASAPSSVFQFELNRAEVDDVLQTIDAIQRTIKEATVAPVAASPAAAVSAAIDA